MRFDPFFLCIRDLSHGIIYSYIHLEALCNYLSDTITSNQKPYATIKHAYIILNESVKEVISMILLNDLLRGADHVSSSSPIHVFPLVIWASFPYSVGTPGEISRLENIGVYTSTESVYLSYPCYMR